MNMAASGDLILNSSISLDKFLIGVQSRAFRIAQIATGNPEDALDLVQDAMFKLVEKYSDRSKEEWTPLF
jgi:RNA polymerase sigma-70 factor (ECF subfamily)